MDYHRGDTPVARRAYANRSELISGVVDGTVTLHQRYLYRGYLRIAACDLLRPAHPCLWLITWDPTQDVATRPLAIQKDGIVSDFMTGRQRIMEQVLFQPQKYEREERKKVKK